MRRLYKRFTAVIMCAILLCSISAAASSGAAAVPMEQYESYRDIPGVTAEEITAVEALKAEYGSFTYGMALSTECFAWETGEIGGFAALFAARLSELFGIDFNVSLYGWRELETKLLDGSVQFTGEGAGAVPGSSFFQSAIIAERPLKQVSLYSRESLAAFAKERPLRYAFLAHSTARDFAEPYLPANYITHEVEEAPEAFQMMTDGTIDVFLDDNTIEAVLALGYDFLLEDFTPTIYNEATLLTCTDKLAPIINIVTKYLNADGGAEIIDLYAAGRHAYLQHKLWEQLTPEEQKYVVVHRSPAAVIPMMLEYDNYPLSFYNTRENEWQGIAIDIIDDIEALTGMTFGCVNTRTELWPSMLARLEAGDAALTSELIRTPERENRFIWTETPYLTDYYAMLSKTDYPDINLAQVKYARVGMIAGSAFLETFQEMFPNHNQVTFYDTIADAFDALDAGKIDIVMATRNLLLYATNYMERVGYKENIVLEKSYASDFGFNKNEEVLCSIMGKALKLVDTRRISDFWTRKVFDYRGKMARAQVPYLIAASMLLIAGLTAVVFLLMKNRKAGRQLEHLVTVRTSELLERTKALEIQTEMAQAATLAKSDFLARMSHEIRTPLNAIIGMTAIAKKTAAETKTLESLEAVTSASSHLLGILNDILDMSKIEVGKFMLSEEAFDFRVAMDEVAEMIHQRCVEKNISFIRAFALPAQAGVTGDKLRLKQVLINLLGNAVKFTPDGGAITMGIACETAESGLRITFRVQDTGIGITDEQMDKLFAAFEQAHSGIAVKYGGTGLGLAISQNLVRLMGGEITVDSAPGKGSTFLFTLTLSEALLNVKDAEEAVDTNFAGKRILLAEDVEINRTILAEMLSDTNLVIDEADDGRKAVDCFAASAPGTYDLIFMDIQMPVLNGYEATQCIRALKREDAKSIPIIAMTANAYKEDVDHAILSGMNAHLAKPIDLTKVLETLSQYLK